MSPVVTPVEQERAAERPGSTLLWTALLVGAAMIASRVAKGDDRRDRRSGPGASRGPVRQSPMLVRERSARRVDAGAATLALSVLADSGIAHYRGGFFNPVMYAAPVVSALTLASAAAGVRHPARGGAAPLGMFGAATLAGMVGFGFHVRNLARRERGWSWENLFYGAPVAAPLALSMAGALGLAGSRVAHTRRLGAPRLLGMSAGRVLALGVAAGLLGTTSEAALLHFRGAYHNHYMWLPVTVPPATAVLLAVAALSASSAARAGARAMLGATALLGLIGVGFHAYGVARNMGGWRNWTQNVQNGPPLPAPPAFTGLALAGLGAVELLSAEALR